MEATATKIIEELKNEIDTKDKELQDHKKEFNEFKVNASKSIGILKALIMRDYDFDDDIDDKLDYNNIRKLKRKKKENKDL